MDNVALTTTGQTRVDLIPTGADKCARSRLAHFVRWQTSHGRPWHDPDLTAYRDAMLADGKQPATVAAHLSTVRARYRAIVKDNATRQALFDAAAQVVGVGPADRKAFVDEMLTRIENAIDPDLSPVKQVTRQDRPDSDELRLTAEQAGALLAAPGVDTARGLRDTAIIGLLLCTGVREAELTALDVPDLRQRLGGELALHVREGKGCKERLVPYGALSWALAIVDRWLEVAGVQVGAVVRGFYRDGQTVRPGRLTVRAVQDVLGAYPIVADGDLVTVKPHDCRRTYARRLYEAGVDVVAIQQNLGHSDLKTTLGYIGALDVARRRPPAIYAFDVAGLMHQAKMAFDGEN